MLKVPAPSCLPFRLSRRGTAIAVILVMAVVASAIVAAQTAARPATPGATAVAAKRFSTPPLPAMGFAPVRPIDVVKATYDFAAQHPEVLRYVPCFCGCGMEAGHVSNEACFIARRDARGNVTEWDTHGFGCTICVDVAREAMQLYSSGASVAAIRASIDKKWTPDHAGMATHTAKPPAK